ncbi:MAG: hypothetical protein KC618_09100, partial [Candidatus Omnitrophica bacterium]|nr:hypothetical protein [Candidatus Omnitrophota bacterium]
SIKASEMTTEEFLLHLRNSDKLTSQHKQILKDFLSSCDLVKFAKHVPGDSEIQDGINAARDLIQQTKPAESS